MPPAKKTTAVKKAAVTKPKDEAEEKPRPKTQAEKDAARRKRRGPNFSV